MTAIEIVELIERENTCTVSLAAELTQAMQDEGIMSKGLAVLYRPAFNDFGIVNADYKHKGILQFDPAPLDEIKFAILVHTEHP